MSLPSAQDVDPPTTMSRWDADHLQATLVEIEHAVDQHLSAYRAGLITATAADSVANDRPLCPDGGRALQRVGTRAHHLCAAHDGELAFTEPALRGSACGAGVSPD